MRAFFLAVAVLGTAACGAEPAVTPRPRLVVMLATCTLRRDVLGPYDARVAYTPRITELGREGAVMLRHETESGQSGTDFAALFAGVHADVHGVYHHPRALSEELELVGEVFAGAGYETWFLGGHGMATHDLGYGQGIPPERASIVPGARQHNLLRSGDSAFQRVVDGLAADPSGRAFVLANFSFTHSPYTIQVRRAAVLEFARRFPEFGGGVVEADLERWLPFYDEHRFELEWNLPGFVRERGLSDADVADLARVLEVVYRAAVVELDKAIGELIDVIRAAGLWEETLFCFTADHGEALHREGLEFHWTHGLQLAPEVLGVPWIVRAPGLAPRVHAQVTRSIDVLPTLAGLCGIPLAARPEREGIDLSAALHGRAPPPEPLAFSHTSVVGPFSIATFSNLRHVLGFYPRTDPALCWTRVRDGDLVVKHLNTGGETWRTQAFDLAADPLELHDLHDPADPRQRELVAALAAYRERLIAGYHRTQGLETPDEDDLQRLRDLGYAR